MKKIILLIVALTLVACSDPHSTIISSAEADKEKMQSAMKKLSDEERELVAAYMMRTIMTNAFAGKEALPNGITIGDAIKQQKAWLADQKVKEAEAAALKVKLQAERDATEKQMRDAVTVTLVKKSVRTERGYSGIEMDQYIEIIVGYQNNGSKPIAGVKGRLIIYDIFDKEVTAFMISSDGDIEPGKSITWEGGRSIKYGTKSTEDKQFAYMDDGKYKAKWEPEMVVFKDGTKITATN